ncbi:MAG TPA: Ig-like domain-containing protein, partial [Candidatus Sulfotelmatobacter sp.]
MPTSLRALQTASDPSTLSLESLSSIDITSMSSKEQRLTDPAAAIFVISSEDKKVKRRISMMCFLVALLATFFAGCGGKEADNTQDTNPPFVSLTTPLQGAGGVILNPLISATFSKAVNASTINTATFTVASAGDQLTGTVALTGNTATFTPTNRLVAQDATYTATITNGVKDLAGTSMQAPYVWTFETVAVPSVVSASPADGAIGVPVSQELTATFLQDPDSPNQALNCSTLTATSFTLTASSGTVAGAITCVGAIAAFSPTLLLAQNTMYTATIASGVRNLAGMELTTPYVWTFTTGLQPTVVSTIPANGASDVLSDQTINATLSAVMNCSTLYAPAKTFTLNGPRGTAIAGTVNCTGSAVSFVPATQLAPGTLFSAAISTGATDTQGQPLVPGVTPNPWTFRTAGALITPKVTSTNPGNTSAGAPFNQIILATFSEMMNLATINKMTFLLIAPGGTAVAGAVTSLGSTAKFTPATNLAPLTTYIATITTGAIDLAGNPLAANYVWSFTTGAAPDTTPPTIT